MQVIFLFQTGAFNGIRTSFVEMYSNHIINRNY